MAKPEYLSLSKRFIDRLSVDDKDTVFWDRDLPGFGIRVYPSGAKVYVVQTRVFGRSKRVTVGRHSKLSADQARKEATRIIARIKAGESAPLVEPAAAPTVADLAERYQREYVAMHCKPLTVSHYGLMLRKHIVPALGKLLVSEVERKHIMAFQYGLRDMPTVANRTVDILVKMFNLADAWGWRPSGRNPCRFVRRYKVEKHHERFLTHVELYRLGRALDAASSRAAGVNPCGRGDPVAGADRVPAERGSGTSVGGSGLRGRRDAVGGHQDRSAGGAAAAGGGEGAGGPLTGSGQSVGVSGEGEGRPPPQHQRLLGPCARAGRSRRRAPS